MRHTRVVLRIIPVSTDSTIIEYHLNHTNYWAHLITQFFLFKHGVEAQCYFPMWSHWFYNLYSEVIPDM